MTARRSFPPAVALILLVGASAALQDAALAGPTAHTSAGAATVPRAPVDVGIIEFTFDGADDDKTQYVDKLDLKLNYRLSKSASVGAVHRISAADWEFIANQGKRDEFLERKGIGYLIRGELESLGGGGADENDARLQVHVVLEDVRASAGHGSWPGNADESNPFEHRQTLRKTLESVEPFYEKVVDDFIALIEGTRLRDMVFAYCFKTRGDLGELSTELPMQLKERLIDKLPEYEVRGFEYHWQVAQECEEEHRNLLAYSEYIIAGSVFRSDTGAGPLIIQVRVWENPDNRPLQFPELSAPLDRRTIVRELADHIYEQWKAIVVGGHDAR